MRKQRRFPQVRLFKDAADYQAWLVQERAAYATLSAEIQALRHSLAQKHNQGSPAQQREKLEKKALANAAMQSRDEARVLARAHAITASAAWQAAKGAAATP